MSNYNYLTIKECANKVGVSTYTIREMIKDGKLKSLRVGSGYRVNEDDLTATFGEVNGNYITIDEVANILKVSTNYVRSLIKDGKLEANVPTYGKKVRKESFDAFLCRN